MIRQVEIQGEAAIPLASGAVLVASKSQPGGWHAVEGGRCDCLGFVHRGACRHLRAVAALNPPTSPVADHATALPRRETTDASGLFLPERPRPPARAPRSFEDIFAGAGEAPAALYLSRE